jgi:prolyl-tRNA synthetase
MHLEFRAVAADTGQIGGSASHEFQVLAESGEDAIAWCPASDYAANVELAEALPLAPLRPQPSETMQKVPTPGKATCEEVAELLNLPLSRTVKCIMLATDIDGAPPRLWMLLIRGDHALNEVKVTKVAGLAKFRWAAESGRGDNRLQPGLSGPSPADLPLIVDRSVSVMADFICGANERDFHLRA